MKKPRLEYRKTEIAVSGHSPFPLDMLRYDNAVPLSSEDAVRISDTHYDHVEHRIVRLARFSCDGGKATFERWLSFGWRVIDDTGTL